MASPGHNELKYTWKWSPFLLFNKSPLNIKFTCWWKHPIFTYPFNIIFGCKNTCSLQCDFQQIVFYFMISIHHTWRVIIMVPVHVYVYWRWWDQYLIKCCQSDSKKIKTFIPVINYAPIIIQICCFKANAGNASCYHELRYEWSITPWPPFLGLLTCHPIN